MTMMPKKMRTMRKINNTYYMNSDGDYIRMTGQRNGSPMWFIEIDGEADGYWVTKEAAFKAFANAVERS